ncbi:MAG: CidA/LrgA family protein [Burkholderiales bacterium]|jgi:holin-like protein|nr:CidA/LrgA family protein [Burkholderiales bacterium]
MLGALTVLLVFQLIGEVLVQFAGLPIPGPVIGLLLLFLSLCVRGGLAVPLRDTANGILQHLSLLFVPAGVGVMVHFSRVSGEWLPILAATIISTALAIGVSALVMQALMRGRSGGEGGTGGGDGGA